MESAADAIEYKPVSLDQITRPAPAAGNFVHSVLSFTRLEIPEVELFETAVTFDATSDPLSAHDALADVFGHKAGTGYFLFRADSAIAGRYWVRSVEPWTRWPTGALSALEPKRIVVQLAEGLMYRFTLPVCAGREFIEGKEKRIEPYRTVEEIDAWFAEQAKQHGMRLLLANVSLQTLRFAHKEQRFKIAYATIEGALEVGNAPATQRRLIKGFGSYRRTGLGMMQLSA
jgi:CRISPR-associated protein Cas6/Cse3/CasE subtype I-E